MCLNIIISTFTKFVITQYIHSGFMIKLRYLSKETLGLVYTFQTNILDC